MFIPLTAGRVTGLDELGTPLPGWPVTTGGVELRGAPALGDLDGDGSLEVICGAANGNVWAWHASGSVVTGFPFSTGTAGISGSVALSDFDGSSGVEIAVTTDTGNLFLISGDGAALANWPQPLATPIRSPVVMRQGLTGPPMIVMTAGTRLWGSMFRAMFCSTRRSPVRRPAWAAPMRRWAIWTAMGPTRSSWRRMASSRSRPSTPRA